MKPKESTYTIVENAGCEGERVVRSFPTATAAYKWKARTYDQDEIESLSVLVRRDHPDGTNTYEF